MAVPIGDFLEQELPIGDLGLRSDGFHDRPARTRPSPTESGTAVPSAFQAPEEHKCDGRALPEETLPRRKKNAAMAVH